MSGQRPLQRLKSILIGYLLLSGLAAHLAVLGAVYWHYQQAGKPLNFYLHDLSTKLAERSPKLVPVSKAIRAVFFGSGLLRDPEKLYPTDINFAPPRWIGLGANALRRDTDPRYGSSGQPISLAMAALWSLRAKPPIKTVTVASVASLQTAIDQAEPGTTIVLAPGRYRLPDGRKLKPRRAGTADRPIVLRGQTVDSVILETAASSSLDIDAPYWVVSDLVVRGRCGPSACGDLIKAGPDADALTVRNIFATGYRHLISDASGRGNLERVADGITLVGGRIVDSSQNWRLADNRVLPEFRGGQRFLQVCASAEDPAICDSDNLQRSIDNAAQDSLVLLRAGQYTQAASVNTPGLHLIAEPGAILFRTAAAGKGALVSNAELTVEGVECAWIKVADGNGACVRQQKGDLTLVGVHFHHSQMGLLTGHQGGKIKIYDSYFHDSGYDRDGALGHNVYVNSGEFQFIRSWSVSARNEGHELKSRARTTEIRDSFIASLNAADSRLVDIPSGGVLTIENSLLAEGPQSTNWQLIGYGLEMGGQPKHAENRYLIRNNTIYSDRPNGSDLINAEHAEEGQVEGNVLVGLGEAWKNNVYFPDREAVGIGAYPRYVRLNAPGKAN